MKLTFKWENFRKSEDFGDVIVHIFLPDSREHYNLERLWADAEEIDLENI